MAQLLHFPTHAWPEVAMICRSRLQRIIRSGRRDDGRIVLKSKPGSFEHRTHSDDPS
jgi:hypothetical protein